MPPTAADVGSDLRRIAAHIARHWPAWARLVAAAALMSAMLGPVLLLALVCAGGL
jgi:hypothetical protein